jgi:hypothetical protein
LGSKGSFGAPILGRTHVDIVKPTDEKDEVVLTVETFLDETKFFGLDEALVAG